MITKKTVFEMVKNNPAMLYQAMPKEFKELFPVVTIETAKEFGIHFTTKHTGKMSGMISLSTTCACVSECENRMRNAVRKWAGRNDLPDGEIRKIGMDLIKENPLRQDVSICLFCFSHRQQERQGKSMNKPLIKNFEILNGGRIHPDWLPVINAAYSRGESFGDFHSENYAHNAFTLAEKNPETRFTVWTKNPVYFRRAILAGHKKPENLKIMFSSQYINYKASVPDSYKDIIDGVFTVYTEEYARENNIKITCGARACLACLRCYKTEGRFDVSELLK